MFVHVYANPFIGTRTMNIIKKWEVRRNVNCMLFTFELKSRTCAIEGVSGVVSFIITVEQLQ